MFQLQFQDRLFSSLEDFTEAKPLGNPVADQAMAFCRAWLSGKEEFQQFTSGSTGRPKEILINRTQMKASAQATGAFFGMDEESLLCCCLHPAYIAGKMMLVRAMEWNCPVILIPPSSDPLSELAEERIPDLIAMVPLQIQQSLQNPISLLKLKKVKQVIIGGAPLSAPLKSELILNQIQAYQTYGMTETVSHIALAKIGTGELIYQTLPEVEIGVDDRQALWVKSPMSLGEKIQTNDVVRLGSAHEFQWIGRTDFVVNSGGIKLHPERIESKIEEAVVSHFPNARFFLKGIPDPKFGEKLVLIIESAEKNEIQANHLLSQLTELLPPYECPKAVYFLSVFSQTGSGKIDRNMSIPQ
ncbi:AMP-binding protein [Algoriphagus sp.]|uniref:AMP-binding protein n=1 Tax=Algoriphagus sp. TaxID=1872435 RepID=UPI0026080840|nr:AMP-binding protein [Algoriphagus sp.]